MHSATIHDLTTLLYPLMVKENIFNLPAFADDDPEVWEHGCIDMSIESIEAAVDALGATLVRRNKRWHLFYRDQPVARTV